MSNINKKTHTDQIWCSTELETQIVKQLHQALTQNQFQGIALDPYKNYGHPQVYVKHNQSVSCRLVDSVFLEDTEAWTRNAIITDNIPLRHYTGKFISVLPEFWHIWRFHPIFVDRLPMSKFNCFMNRVSGDRSIVFYELIRRNLLDQGIVSYNCFRPGSSATDQENYDQQYLEAELFRYADEHEKGRQLIPYNTITESLEQSIIDSRVSLVLETYTSDSHIVFSEKLFRVLQMPRPWLLYCSFHSIQFLRDYGFDVLDDYVDHSYDNLPIHSQRLTAVLDQLEQVIHKEYTSDDLHRFQQAADHNQKLLDQFSAIWSVCLNNIINNISQL